MILIIILEIEIGLVFWLRLGIKWSMGSQERLDLASWQWPILKVFAAKKVISKPLSDVVLLYLFVL